MTVASTFLGIHAAYWNVTALKLGLGVGLALLGAGTFVYVFLFKMVSHLQKVASARWSRVRTEASSSWLK